MSFMKKIAKYFFSICVFLLLSACGKLGAYQFEPVKDITFSVTINDIKSMPKHQSMFLYCDMVIENKSDISHNFDLSKLQARFNGIINESTYYDSLASVMPEIKKLDKGKNVYKIYLVYSDSIDISGVKSFELTNFGLSK